MAASKQAPLPGVTLLFLAFLVGCAGACGRPYLVDGPGFLGLGSVPEGKGLLYLYRMPQPHGGANGIQFFVTAPKQLQSMEAAARAGVEERLLGVERAEGGFILVDPHRSTDERPGRLPADDYLRWAFSTDRRVFDLHTPRHTFLPVGYGGAYLLLGDFAYLARIPRSGGYLPFLLDPGQYLFLLGEEMSDDFLNQPYVRLTEDTFLEGIVVDIQEGGTYYLRGTWQGSRLHEVDATTASREITDCRLVMDQGRS